MKSSYDNLFCDCFYLLKILILSPLMGKIYFKLLYKDFITFIIIYTMAYILNDKIKEVALKNNCYVIDLGEFSVYIIRLK